MEVVQQVSVQIAAASLGDAKALTDELEQHRAYLRRQRGFRSMQITRAQESDGNTSLTIDTRWRSAADLATYTDQSNNVFSIVDRHSAIAVPGTTQVRRLDAVDKADDGASPLYERMAWAFLVPIGALAFGLAVIYSVSRIFLATGDTTAVVIAAALSLTILLVAGYFASNPVPRWQYGALGSGVAALMVFGIVWGTMNYEPGHGEAVEGSPTSEPGGTPVPPGQVVIETHDNYFTINGGEEKNPRISIPAAGGTFPVENKGKAIHNIHIGNPDFDVSICKPTDPAPCSNPGSIRGGAKGEIAISLPPGEYTYRCDFHTTEMEGTLVVE